MKKSLVLAKISANGNLLKGACVVKSRNIDFLIPRISMIFRKGPSTAIWDIGIE